MTFAHGWSLFIDRRQTRQALKCDGEMKGLLYVNQAIMQPQVFMKFKNDFVFGTCKFVDSKNIFGSCFVSIKLKKFDHIGNRLFLIFT